MMMTNRTTCCLLSFDTDYNIGLDIPYLHFLAAMMNSTANKLRVLFTTTRPKRRFYVSKLQLLIRCSHVMNDKIMFCAVARAHNHMHDMCRVTAGANNVDQRAVHLEWYTHFNAQSGNDKYIKQQSIRTKEETT